MPPAPPPPRTTHQPDPGAEREALAARAAALRAEQGRLLEAAARKGAEAEEVERKLGLREAVLAAGGPEVWRDWAAGLPRGVLAKVASTLVAQNEAAWAAQLKERSPNLSEERIQEMMAKRKRDGTNCLFVFARVCKEWRKAQLRVGDPLRTRVESDVILPGGVALAKWALAEGCPREGRYSTMAEVAAEYGHLELVKWLCGEWGFQISWMVTLAAARGGNQELAEWLRMQKVQEY